jgi:hypothetical protein
MKHLTSFLLPFIFLQSHGQTKEYLNLLYTELGRHGGIFVHSKPLTNLRLDKEDMWMSVESLRDYSHTNLDTSMFSQIIQNSKTLDSTLWRDKELTNYLLVNSRDQTVSKNYVVDKFSLTDKKKIKFYKRQINEFNSVDTYNRNLYYFSRPVFDNSKEFAIVQWDNGHGGLGGGGGILLYNLKGGTWTEIGAVMNWKY